MSHNDDEEMPDFHNIMSDREWAEHKLNISRLVQSADVYAAFKSCLESEHGTSDAESKWGRERLYRDVRGYFRKRIIPWYVARYLQRQQ